MTLDTWINDALITIETDDVWSEVFAEWDGRVDTDLAARIASAVSAIVTAAAQENQL